MTWYLWLLLGYCAGCTACLLAHLVGPCPWAGFDRHRPPDPRPIDLGPFEAGRVIFLDKDGRVVSGDTRKDDAP